MVTPESIAAESESSQQSALFCWAAIEAVTARNGDQDERRMSLVMLHAIPNGDQRGDGTKKGAQIAGNRLVREGLRSGVPDVCLPVPRAHFEQCGLNVHEDEFIYCGLYIEMKRPYLKRAADPLHGCSDDQKKWITSLRLHGYRVEVCYTWIEAREVILDYLGLPSQTIAWGQPVATII